MPTREEILAVLKLAEAAGVKLLVQFRAPDGFMERPIRSDTLADCLTHKRSAAAAAVGLSELDFLEWVENNGGIQCIATTAKGMRCKCFVSNAHYTNALDWKRANDAGGYCNIHNGE